MWVSWYSDEKIVIRLMISVFQAIFNHTDNDFTCAPN